MASITLPLQGYCRSGRYFPVLIDGTDAARPLELAGEGCLPTQVAAGAGRRWVPILVTGFPASLKVEGISLPLHEASSSERLIGSLTADVSSAAAVFPNRQLVPIPLDAVDPLPGPTAAWETLDAVLLEPQVLSRITDAQRSALLAGGVDLISMGDSAPDNRWPWQRKGDLWVLSHTPAGPVGECVNEDVFGPTYAMSTGWPIAVRQQVLGIAALLVLVVWSLLLRSRRWTLWTAVALILATAGGIVLWRRSLSTLSVAGGDILIARSGLVQRDAWVFQRARESGPQTVPWTGWTHPLFGSRTGLANSAMSVSVSSTGSMQFTYTAIAGHTMAFVRREVTPGTTPVASMPVKSPMSESARVVYLTAGTHVAGEIDGGAGRWGSVVVAGKAK